MSGKVEQAVPTSITPQRIHQLQLCRVRGAKSLGRDIARLHHDTASTDMLRTMATHAHRIHMSIYSGHPKCNPAGQRYRRIAAFVGPVGLAFIALIKLVTLVLIISSLRDVPSGTSIRPFGLGFQLMFIWAVELSIAACAVVFSAGAMVKHWQSWLCVTACVAFTLSSGYMAGFAVRCVCQHYGIVIGD